MQAENRNAPQKLTTKQVTAVTQKKLMNARILKSKSPTRKAAPQQQQDPKTSIFKGPVNQEFFTKVESIQDGIQIVTAQGLGDEEDEEALKLEEEEALEKQMSGIKETEKEQSPEVEEEEEQQEE